MMITLTSNPAVGDSPTDRAQRMSAAFNKLVKRIKRRTKLLHLPYFVAVEATQNHEPHFHVLLRAPFIPQAWLSTQWNELTGAPIVHIKRIKNPRSAARYISKYISKAPARFGTMKRYWHSKDWDLAPPVKSEHDWSNARTYTLEGVSQAWIVTLLRQAGWKNIRAGPDGVEAERPYPGAPIPLQDCMKEISGLPRRRSAAVNRGASSDRADDDAPPF